MTGAADTNSPIKKPKISGTTDPRRQNETWVQPLLKVVNMTDPSVESRFRTSLSCDVQSRQPTFYWPSDMEELQPRNFRYLQSFAKKNGFKLIEDRRHTNVQPILEKRDRTPPTIALGLSLLMKQTGVPGAARIPSTPHRLNSDSQHIGIGNLVRMAAFAAPESKRVVVLPNRILVNALKDTQPIAGYACNMSCASTTTILSLFDSPHFRTIGYSTGSQYVTHICLAGGPREIASLWTQLPTLTNSDVKLQLFPGKHANEDFGIFYITFYLNMAENPAPWWLTSDTHESAKQVEALEEATDGFQTDTLRKAS